VSTETPPLFTAREYRDTVGLFPTGVAVVTAVNASGDRLGLTVSSFSSVSIDPPLVSFSLARSANSFDDWLEVRHFAINLLTQEQMHLSSKFAQALTDKWHGISHSPGKSVEVPVLEGALACFECETFARYDGGDHVIVLGKILSLDRHPHDGQRPLVFFRSRYHQLRHES
jgi:flavin reductase (DIM6/NTAB) family NADH-FMN oxidoreductase RutF